jgi:hypothetical protein
VIDTQNTMSNSAFTLLLSAVYVPLIVYMVWGTFGKQLRRWWRRRKLNIPDEEKNVRTIIGPLWEVGWVKVSETGEKYPEEQRSTVLGNDLPQVVQVLKAKFGDEFEEKNVRRASKQSYTNVIVGIPEKEGQ